MSNSWQFSSYSEPLVQKLLQTVVKLDNNNEWSKKFGKVNKHHLKRHKVQKLHKEHIIDIPDDEPRSEEAGTAVSGAVDKILETNAYDELFCNTIEADPSNIDYMMEECLKRPNLIIDLAEHLTMSAVEKVFNTIYTKQNINGEFISLYIQKFFPVFLQREQTWLTLDLLLKASKSHPEAFEPVLIKLIKDVKIKSTILQELVQNLGAEFPKHLIFLITHIDISSDIFIHHMHTIHLAYRDCEKTEHLQSFIQTKLVESASHCTDDKNYGRLFLTFLQAQKVTGFPTNISMLDSCMTQHNSPFKRPCLNILKELAEKNQT